MALTQVSTNGIKDGNIKNVDLDAADLLSNNRRTITVSTSDPTNSDGADGDVWFTYTA